MRKISAFTLIETIIYIGLFGIIFSGIFVSMYPLFASSAKLTSNVTAEEEAAFIITKINFALKTSLTDRQGKITSPAEGETTDELILSRNGNELFHFTTTDSSEYCTTPLLCNMLTLEEQQSGRALPLNTQRVAVKDFKVTHTEPTGQSRRYIDVSFTVNNIPFGPVRFYLHF